MSERQHAKEPTQMSTLEHPQPEGLMPNPAYSHVVAATSRRKPRR